VLSSVVFPLAIPAARAQSNIPVYATIGPEAAPILRVLVGDARLIPVEPGMLGTVLRTKKFAAIFASRDWMGQDDLRAAYAASKARLFWLQREVTVASIESNISTVAQATGTMDAGLRWAANIQAGLDRIRQEVHGQTTSRVLILTPEGYTAGQGALITELIALAGGVNVAAEAGIPDARDVDDSQIRQFAPEVVLLMDWTTQSASISTLAYNPAYRGIAAFDRFRLYPFTLPANDPSRLVATVQGIVDLIHPQEF